MHFINTSSFYQSLRLFHGFIKLKYNDCVYISMINFIEWCLKKMKHQNIWFSLRSIVKFRQKGESSKNSIECIYLNYLSIWLIKIGRICWWCWNSKSFQEISRRVKNCREKKIKLKEESRNNWTRLFKDKNQDRYGQHFRNCELMGK